MEQKDSSIEAVDHRVQVSPRERVGVDEHDMAARAPASQRKASIFGRYRSCVGRATREESPTEDVRW
jgi:hypothetical protein